MKELFLVILFLFLACSIIIFSIYFIKIRITKQPQKYSQSRYNNKLELHSKYSNFKNCAQGFTAIPGLKEKIIPQGITYSKKYNLLIVSGYHYGKISSVLFFIEYKTGNLLKTLILSREDESDFNEHVGGVTTDDETLWIVSNYKIYEYSLEKLIDRNDMDRVKYDKVFNTFTKADYVTYHNGILWIGEYNYKDIYKTIDNHTVTTPNYQTNKSLLSGYIVNKDNNYYIPDYLISIPDRIQGVTFDNDGNFIFSRSFWSFQSSNITIYPNILTEKWKDTFEIENKKIPLNHFDDLNYISNIEIPPMSEEMVYIDDNLYIVFESNSTLYKYYTKNKIGHIIKFKI